MKEAHRVLAAGKIDAGLAADRGVDLGEKGGGELHEFDTAQEAAGGEAAEIAGAATAEGQQPAVAFAARRKHLVPEPPGRFHRLRLFPVLHLENHPPRRAPRKRTEPLAM